MLQRLDEFDKIEWRDILREAVRTKGGVWSEETFEADWEEFVTLKSRKHLQ